MKEYLTFKKKIISAIVVDWTFLMREQYEGLLFKSKNASEESINSYERKINLISKILSFT